MIENLGRNFSELKMFITEAKRLGIYSPGQVSNFMGVVVLLEKLEAVPLMTVGMLKNDIDTVMNTYAANSRASHDSVATYKQRAVRLIDDFIEHHGGDVAAWKAEIAKAGNGSPARQRSRTSKPKRTGEIESMGGLIPLSPSQRHPLRLSGGRNGELTLPADLVAADIEAVWKQLTALKGLIEAQAEAVAGEEETD